MRLIAKGAAIAALALSFGAAAGAEDLPVLRAAVLETGTVNWELSTIVENGLDRKHGFELKMQTFADNGATRVALAGDEADMVVADWIWTARERAAGKDYVTVPYSKNVGGLVVPEGSDAETLADLAGGKIGIAGGPLDKSWLIFIAYAKQELDFDLAGETEQVYGAPPLIYKTGLTGETDGAINFWHFLAKMKAEGMRELISVDEASEALGLDTDVPLLGYVMKESFIEKHPGIDQALYDASRDAKDLMMEDAVWEDIRPRMNADTEAQFETLRTDYRTGIPARGPVDAGSADKLLRLMADLGGEELVGKATSLPDGTFAEVE